VVALVDAADEIPNHLPRNGAVIVGSRDNPTWVAFDCPCVQHHRVMLNLDARRRPVWTLRASRPLTLHPSVNELRAGTRCHYFVRSGKVHWARDTTEQEQK
jgi:hypothetical protein